MTKQITLTINQVRDAIESMIAAADDMELIITTDGRLEQEHESYIDKEDRAETLCDGRSLYDSLEEWDLIDEDGELTASDEQLKDFFEELNSMNENIEVKVK